MADVALAILWHQHQPYYPDDVAGANPMPWVRLHGVKDYYGMALHLLEAPEMQCTINLVPSLVRQIRQYTDQGASDHFLDLSRIPADGLTADQAHFILDNFFLVQTEHFIRPRPRYRELLERRAFGQLGAPEALSRFTVKDLRDLQVWFNLAWIHPLAFERDAELAELRLKGKNFSEEDKQVVLARHFEILKKVLPLHKQLVDRGQVELTTTPFYHPILPLLIDKKLAREALPDVRLPRHAQSYWEDAVWQVNEAVKYHAEVFGQKPRGMWPAEGSVCQAMIPLLADAGIKWFATDEEILGETTKGYVGRDSRGLVRNPAALYQPCKVSEGDKELGIVFRDHTLSDLIGFHYQRSDSHAAAEDFVSRLRDIGATLDGASRGLVTVALDGENCWEHYPGGGVAFLRALYQRLTAAAGVHPVRLSDFLEAHPPRTTLPRLAAGSWINHNFEIWIGFDEDNAGWDLLHETREHLVQRLAARPFPADVAAAAWREIYIAEGSDWFWWYGPQFTSAQDGVFDYLFRKHLQNVYTLLGETPPPGLSQPILTRAPRPVFTQPRSFLDVKLDGKRRPIEWMGAGVYRARGGRGTMAMVSRGIIQELHFGFTPERLLLRIDLDGPAKARLADFDELRLVFDEPANFAIAVEDPGRSAAVVRYGGREPHGEANVALGIDQTVTVGIPFELLGVQVNEPIRFSVELRQAGQIRDRAPLDQALETRRPSADFERIHWDV
jgi:alpha-amylase/alpha-mannosidase (GH57 family)